jgi:hypothetical protein
MNESTVKYMAGLLDADGSLSLMFRKHGSGTYLALRLTLTSSDAVDRHGFVENLPNTLGMGTAHRYGKNQQFITWTVAKRADLEMILPRLIKHMLIKATHWQWLLDVWREHRGQSVDDDKVQALKDQSKFSRSVSGPLKPKNYPTWAWMAGFMDGDGYYTCRRNRPPRDTWAMRIGCVIHRNDRHVLELIQKAYGGKIVEHGQSPSCLCWYRNAGVSESSFVLSFLSKMARFSMLKRRKIDHMIHIHQQRLSISTSAEEATV